MSMPNQTPPPTRAVEREAPSRFWRASAKADRVVEPAFEGESSERRSKDRRGSAITVFRFTNDRRDGMDRRGAEGRGFEMHPVPVPGEMRHCGVSYGIVTADISPKGARLLDAPPLPPGALVRLTLEPEDDLAEYPLVVWAEVRSFCGERAMLGVRFVSLRGCDSRRLARLVSRASE